MEQLVQSRTASCRVRHKSNPYKSAIQTHSVTVFVPDDYTLTSICKLSARALRVLVILAAYIDNETGMAHCSKKELNRYFSANRVNLSHATAELIDAGLICKGKSLNTYYLNPKAFQVVTLPTFA